MLYQPGGQYGRKLCHSEQINIDKAMLGTELGLVSAANESDEEEIYPEK